MASDPPLIPKVPSLSDVEFVERLGRGMGAGRFKARMDGRRRPVCLLVFDPKSVDHGRLTRWTRRRVALDHPRVPKVARFETERSPGFLATEFIDAESLEQVTKGAVSFDETAGLKQLRLSDKLDGTKFLKAYYKRQTSRKGKAA